MSYVAGKKVLVTGATDGIGKELALLLSGRGAHVLVHGREPDKVEEVISQMRTESGKASPHPVICDLKSLEDVRRFAQEIREKHPDLGVLINNAGIYSPEQEITPDGFEATLQVNYLAPFLLTNLLVDSLKANENARIVNVTSTLHFGARLEPESIFDTKGKYDGQRAYGTSKLALVLFTTELADRIKSSGVTVNCVHPGAIDTKLLRTGFGEGGEPVREGAKPILFVAESEDLFKITGAYYSMMRKDDPDVRARDRNLRSRLWIATEQAIGMRERGAEAPGVEPGLRRAEAAAPSKKGAA